MRTRRPMPGRSAGHWGSRGSPPRRWAGEWTAGSPHRFRLDTLALSPLTVLLCRAQSQMWDVTPMIASPPEMIMESATPQFGTPLQARKKLCEFMRTTPGGL